MSQIIERQNVGTCPRCGYPISATVNLDVEPGKPFLPTGEKRWRASAHVSIASVRVEHACSNEDPNPIADALDAFIEGATEAQQ